ncbi:hypothetical protein KBC75_04480 [Candidatus Shapirobacteria bacterium]|nr:hypothetical protein [Candidatus Shapirobacteria bacterium]
MDLSQYPHQLVRLTVNEMKSLKAKKIGDTFFHANLQHSNSPKSLSKFKHYFATEIKQHGSVQSHTETFPVLNHNDIIFLELIDIKIDIPVKNLPTETKDYLLENKLGLFESLCDKYCPVRSLTPDQILSMNCFIRQFKIIHYMLK